MLACLAKVSPLNSGFGPRDATPPRENKLPRSWRLSPSAFEANSYGLDIESGKSLPAKQAENTVTDQAFALPRPYNVWNETTRQCYTQFTQAPSSSTMTFIQGAYDFLKVSYVMIPFREFTCRLRGANCRKAIG
jgi:hypothetical protein